MTRVLVIEDSPDDRLFVREALAAPDVGTFDVEESDCLSRALERLGRGGVDVVLLDLSLPDSHGFATIDAVREAFPNLPIVVLTGSSGDEIGVEAVRRGAQDFLTKDHLDGRLLVTMIRHSIERARLVREVEAKAEELARSNVDLQDFAYVASHDLQEPLRMVGSYVQLLERRYKGRLDEEADRFIHYAVDGAARMKALIDDLLRYSRVGRGEPERQPVPLQEALEEVAGNLAARLRETGARLTAGDLPIVAGNRSQLVQVLQNLVGNALKYRGEAAPEIDVRATCTDGSCTVSVADNGIGFDPGQAERVFRPFQRLHERGRYSGTGIGLAIVRRIVERHGGRAWADSKPGIGSTFHFSLPLASGEKETT